MHGNKCMNLNIGQVASCYSQDNLKLSTCFIDINILIYLLIHICIHKVLSNMKLFESHTKILHNRRIFYEGYET